MHLISLDFFPALTTLAVHDIPPKPSFTSCFPCITRSDQDAVGESVIKYFIENWPWKIPGDFTKLVGQGLELWTGFTLPTALKDRIECASMLSVLGFMLDDILDTYNHDQTKQFMSRLRGLILGNTHPAADNQVEFVFADIYARIRDTDKTDPFRLGNKYCEETLRWIMALLNQEPFNASVQNTLESYAEYRFTDAGIWWGFSLMEWTCNLPIPENIACDPNFHALQRKFSMHGLLTNDLYSYRREVLQASRTSSNGIKPRMVNSIYVVMVEHNFNEEEATEYIKTRITEVEVSFLEMEDSWKLKYSGDDLAFFEKYFTATKCMIAGNLWWSASCGRYNQI
ncbi:isoprenoid synthase domain-containing protein [Crucibulum laeve]|uniref:Terpene synthase n=1 Tax=Crucibulum laeve TaxID=68775 RepID=A0A5C3LN05_9AGAR|nr:isoprenoid synthase domain-containing protein [Crucibulum laeve]